MKEGEKETKDVQISTFPNDRIKVVFVRARVMDLVMGLSVMINFKYTREAL